MPCLDDACTYGGKAPAGHLEHVREDLAERRRALAERLEDEAAEDLAEHLERLEVPA